MTPRLEDAPILTAQTPGTAPGWALLQRQLIRTMNDAALFFVERYTRPDGTLVWREEWPGMDGSDDAYESFWSFPLFYLLGGCRDVLEAARRGWEAVTWQFTQYGQVHREFDAYYDWMHHGESSQLLYYLSLADPTRLKDRQRAVRFAAFYTGEDEAAPNYDPQLRMIRSPINGSRGPRFEMTEEDWSTHRPVLSHYPAPFEDIPGVDGPIADWTDDAVFREILRLMNQRMARGDVPLNLMATSLVAHAFLHTGEEKYRRWVLDYTRAWEERALANGGIVPDNIGPSGIIGECMDGKWWGGYYGWRWPHGGRVILEAVLVASCNAALLGRDPARLRFIRSQFDALWRLRKEVDGAWHLPNKHTDSGWSDYRKAEPRLPILLWNFSLAQEDRERIERLRRDESWAHVADVIGKGDQAHTVPWYWYITGRFDEYPERILRLDLAHVARRLAAIREEHSDPREWDVHHWQDRNPVLCEGLVHTMLGSPQAVYHGGLLHAHVRYFDEEEKRSGLPEDVAALVQHVAADTVRLTLENLNPLRARHVIVQAGSFGEHRFTRATSGDSAVDFAGPWVRVELPPATRIELALGMDRLAYSPTYQLPWDRGKPQEPLLRPRPCWRP